MSERAFRGARAVGTGSVEVAEDGRAKVAGSLAFATVSQLLPVGANAIKEGRAATIDLAGVTASDSAGLALLIEWLSVARSADQPLRYENIPAQLRQLARLSEVWPLISGEAQVEVGAANAEVAHREVGRGDTQAETAGSSNAEAVGGAESIRDQAP